jgi:copper chaperone CopZ
MITRVRIEGMTCHHCVRAVFTALAGVEGISHADVGIGVAEVEHDGSVTVDALQAAVAIAGYSVAEHSTTRRTLPLL